MKRNFFSIFVFVCRNAECEYFAHVFEFGTDNGSHEKCVWLAEENVKLGSTACQNIDEHLKL